MKSVFYISIFLICNFSQFKGVLLRIFATKMQNICKLLVFDCEILFNAALSCLIKINEQKALFYGVFKGVIKR